MLGTSSLTASLTNATQFAVEYDGADGVDSKYVEKLSKVEKPEKSAKAIGSEKPSFLTSDTRLAMIENCWPWKSLRTASYKHKVLVRSYLCQANGATDALSHLFLRRARKIFELSILKSFPGYSPR